MSADGYGVRGVEGAITSCREPEILQIRRVGGEQFQHDYIFATSIQIPTGRVTHVRKDRMYARFRFRSVVHDFGAAIFVRDSVGTFNHPGFKGIAANVSSHAVADKEIIAGIYEDKCCEEGETDNFQDRKQTLHTSTILD
jgi:hypothetical protein